AAPRPVADGGLRQPGVPRRPRARGVPAARGPARRVPDGPPGRGPVTAGLVAVLLGVAVWLAVPGHGSWARPGGVADGPVDRAGPKGRSPAADGRTQVTEAMDLMALALGTGLPLETALREVAR